MYIRHTFAGALCETDGGYTFTYDAAYLALDGASAVSLTLPLWEEAYTSKTIFPFFDGMIPEGWVLELVSRNWKLDPNDRFGLLLVACRDSIGNVSVKEVRE